MDSKDNIQYEIHLLDTICRGLQATLNVDKIVHIILTGLTAGASLGFSRATLFFINESGLLHNGRGIGPFDRDEAEIIWADLANSSATLEQMFENSHRRTLESQRFAVEIKSITCDITSLPQDSPLRKAISENKIVVLNEAERFFVPEEFHWFVQYSTQVIIAPIMISGKVSAVVFADNAFHYKKITREIIYFLSIILNQAGLALSNAFAYENTRHNLTELRRLNEKLRTMQEDLLVCERFAAAGRISSYLAHEIRNPLATIGGFARQILEICRGKNTDARISRNAKIIVNEVRRLELVLNNLLRFSFKQPAKKESIHLKNFLDELLEVLSINIQDSGVSLFLDVPEQMNVFADRIQLGEVFYNIIHNSLESMKPGGALAIKAGENDSEVWIEISDTGYGIPPDVLKQLFKPFFTTRTHGIGLGLHLVKTIVEENHSGKIDLVSQVDTGTKVTITLPKKEAHGEKNSSDRG
ncbi:MAG: ATP-binding protein [Candidatus Omnitrophica bacterium]|nr:ATP-binding protein [Candidatus Omnitrophota bacterium]MCM8828906.1 ATP-binding protein [Candidatus Omnitrophota bacterium]